MGLREIVGDILYAINLLIDKIGDAVFKIYKKSKKKHEKGEMNTVVKYLIRSGLVVIIDDRFVCTLCGRVFKNGDAIVRHFERFHEDILVGVLRR